MPKSKTYNEQKWLNFSGENWKSIFWLTWYKDKYREEKESYPKSHLIPFKDQVLLDMYPYSRNGMFLTLSPFKLSHIILLKTWNFELQCWKTYSCLPAILVLKCKPFIILADRDFSTELLNRCSCCCWFVKGSNAIHRIKNAHSALTLLSNVNIGFCVCPSRFQSEMKN